MIVPLDETFHFGVVTQSPTTGAASDADSTPTYEVFEEDTDTEILSGSLTKRTGKTGTYRGSFVCSAANGFEAGKFYEVFVSATVGSVAGKAPAAHFRIGPAESVAGVPKVDASHVAGTAQTGRDIGGTLGNAGAGLNQVPWNAAWDAEVQSEADDALEARGYTAARAVKLDNADVAVSTRLASASYTAPLDAAGTRAAVGLASESLDSQLGNIPTVAEFEARTLPSADYSTAAALATVAGYLDTEIAAILARTNLIPDSPAAVGSPMALSSDERTTVVAAVWNALTSGFGVSGSIGARVVAYLTGDAFARLGAPAGASIAADIAAVKAKTDTLPADPASQATTATALAAVQTAVLAKLPAALTADGNIKADALRVGGTAQTAGDVVALIAALTLFATRTVIRGTVGGSSPSTTSFTPSAVSPSGSVANQWKGRIIVFDNDTATVALRGQATDITAATGAALPTLTFTELTTAPSSGDTFSIV